MIINRYLAALLSIGIVLLTAFIAIPAADLNAATVAQLVALGAGAVVTYFVPLLDTKWGGVLKTGAAIVAGVVAALIPFLTQGGQLTGMQVAIVVLAALNALAVEVGVNVRKDAAGFVSGAPSPDWASGTRI